MKRFLTHVNGIISVGEVLVDSGHISADGIMFLRKALDSVHDAIEDKSIKLCASLVTPIQTTSTETKKRKIAEKDAMLPKHLPSPALPTSGVDRVTLSLIHI